MSLPAREIRVRQAGRYLRELLRREPYRRRWAVYGAQREREVHQADVAKVLAAYLQHHDGADADYGQLTRRVSRAMRGETLSRPTLDLFVRAFEFSEEHTAALWRQWQGTDLARVVTGELPPQAAAEAAPEYETISLHEFHYLGADGRPLRHRTLRGIRSLADGLTTYRYTFDTSDLTVKSIGGGRPRRTYQRSGMTWTTEIALTRTLNRGDEHSLEFVSEFHYREDVEPCCRRVAHERLENVAMRVQFHPGKLPRAVWWVQWQDYRPPRVAVIERREVALDSEHVAYHRLDVLDRAVAGFAWEF